MVKRLNKSSTNTGLAATAQQDIQVQQEGRHHESGC
jgi:hypothetical protein